jgi:hypothetical protein
MRPPVRGNRAQKVILMSVHRWPWVIGLAACTAAAVTGCSQPARPGRRPGIA